MADIKRISKICKKHDTLLIVDNAHGAYLKFTDESYHPIDLGADMCCDSAHKTLPVLTGGAYLHISENAPYIFKERAKDALSLFSSSSPSYLILESLDIANDYIENGYKARLCSTVLKVEKLKKDVVEFGFELVGSEKLKLTVATKSYGYFGFEFARILEQKNVICEFSDRDFVVLMFTPENDDDTFSAISEAFASIKKREPIFEKTPLVSLPERKMTIREAIFSKSELVDIHKSKGRVLSQLGVSCPPAVPIAVCGEVIDKTAIECFEYYGIDRISVVKEIL
jgi:arginine/lysine/ornithine decarboxylase